MRLPSDLLDFALDAPRCLSRPLQNGDLQDIILVGGLDIARAAPPAGRLTALQRPARDPFRAVVRYPPAKNPRGVRHRDADILSPCLAGGQCRVATRESTSRNELTTGSVQAILRNRPSSDPFSLRCNGDSTLALRKGILGFSLSFPYALHPSALAAMLNVPTITILVDGG